MRSGLARRLTTRGHAVSAVESGEAAFERARKEKFDVVLLDMWMPGWTGLETLSHIVKLPAPPMVIGISGMATRATEEAARASGIFSFLPKPLPAEELEGEIRRAAAKARSDRAETEEGLRSGGRGRVLVADDHEEFRRALVRRLRLEGFEADAAATGDSAVGLALTRPYDAYLLDIHMPDGTGPDAARRIRAVDPHATVSFMTGEASQSEIRRGQVHALAGCLRKPLDGDRMGQIVDFLVKTGRESRRRAEAREAYAELPDSKKALIQGRARTKRFLRSGFLRDAALAVFVSLAVSLPMLAAFDLAAQARFALADYWDGAPNPAAMYREIAGYLERDEARELARSDGR